MSGGYQDEMVKLVRKEARRGGVRLAPDEALDVLWNQTGFPSFFTGDRDEWFRWQVRHWLANRRMKPCACEQMPCEESQDSLDVAEGLHHSRCRKRVEVPRP
jgi:hypothetical protein